MKLFIRNLIHPSNRGREIDDAVLTVTEEEAAQLEWPLSKYWFAVIWWGALLLLLLLGGRVFYLTIIKGAEYQEMALRNSLRSIPIVAPRGIVYDRTGQALVQNVPTVDLAVIPSDLPRDDAERESVRQRVGMLLGLDATLLESVFASAKNSTVPLFLKPGLSQEELLLVLGRQSELPGIVLVKSAERDYADGAIFSHIIGNEGKIRQEELDQYPEYGLSDTVGKQGIEKAYESALRGENGAARVEVDAMGKIKKELGVLDPIPGSDVILHVDAGLQKKIYDSLQKLLDEKGFKRAAAIAMDPKTGGVLALVSLPSYDNNLFSGGIDQVHYQELITDEAKPLFNRAINGEYPPGSTIKPVIAAAALSEGVISSSTVIDGMGGALRRGGSVFRDWTTHGPSDVRRAIAESNDIFFYTIGGGYGSIPGLGMRRMKTYEELFGYGTETGIDIPGEADGFLPDPDWKQERYGERWYIGNDYHASIGQGFVTATPLQVLNSVSTIANGGTLYQPRVAAQIRDARGKLTSVDAPVVRKDFISQDILRVVREGMRETVTGGTAQSLRDLPVEAAGKTGTAQFGTGKDTHGWFVSFAPYADPEIAMIVLVEGQDEEGYNAVPVTKEVYQWYFGGRKDEE